MDLRREKLSLWLTLISLTPVLFMYGAHGLHLLGGNNHTLSTEDGSATPNVDHVSNLRRTKNPSIQDNIPFIGRLLRSSKESFSYSISSSSEAAHTLEDHKKLAHPLKGKTDKHKKKKGHHRQRRWSHKSRKDRHHFKNQSRRQYVARNAHHFQAQRRNFANPREHAEGATNHH